jgi:hypothetical protein
LGFLDYSDERLEELKSVGASLDYLREPSDYFEVVGDGGSGASFWASNLGLSSFEISIGFHGDDREQTEAKDLAQVVIADLSAHWPVTLLSPDSGALPTGRCPASEVSPW